MVIACSCFRPLSCVKIESKCVLTTCFVSLIWGLGDGTGKSRSIMPLLRSLETRKLLFIAFEWIFNSSVLVEFLVFSVR